LEENDIQVSNRDELGELVDSFNRMKHATRKNIQTLEENQQLAEQLHKEALERAEMEKRLETTRMDLLQSQIKPHFLFNTLNTISGMAELEDAEKTDSMIRSLSRLFRYNLHTTDQFVSFSQEPEVVRDYLYLQQMRFGDRVQYELPDPSDPQASSFGSIMVPVFPLQPLVENAVIHGIAKKEQGGRITISTEQTDDAFKIRVADTGVGMDPDTLDGLMSALRGEPSDVHVGIGIGNLYKRLETLYGPDSMRISSTAGEGTQVDITIPIRM
jgi:sensor histidine kinase YesM